MMSLGVSFCSRLSVVFDFGFIPTMHEKFTEIYSSLGVAAHWDGLLPSTPGTRGTCILLPCVLSRVIEVDLQLIEYAANAVVLEKASIHWYKLFCMQVVQSKEAIVIAIGLLKDSMLHIRVKTFTI